jgi:hypothetical protein
MDKSDEILDKILAVDTDAMEVGGDYYTVEGENKCIVIFRQGSKIRRAKRIASIKTQPFLYIVK